MTKQTLSIRKPYDKSVPVRKTFPKPTMTKQSFQDECNINSIMKKYEQTGLISHTKNVQGSYGDFTNVEDYHAAINRVHAAENAFMALPSQIRKKFNNDPAAMLAFLDDPSNRKEALELGLIAQEPSDIASEAKQSKPAEPLKAVDPKDQKTDDKTADASDGKKT